MRVFPFSFPPIRGGAQGGASPTPIPEPEDYPYNVDNLSIEIEVLDADWSARGDNSAFSYNLTVSGVVVDDVSNVASLKILFDDLVLTANGSPAAALIPISTYYSMNAVISDPNHTASGRYMIVSGSSDRGKTVGVSGDVTFEAYDSNGDVLQSVTVTAVIS